MAVIYIFDPRDYFAIPYQLVSQHIQLAQQLLAIAPRRSELAAAVEALKVRVAKTEARVASLGDDYEREIEDREVEFESWTDAIAEKIHTGLSSWPGMVSPALHAWLPLEQNPDLAAKLPGWHEKAARSRVLHASMFGDDVLDYFRLTYPKRFRMVAGMLRSLAEGELGEKFDDLLSSEFLGSRGAARSGQYDRLAAEHLRERDETRSLAGQRVSLRWGLARYEHEFKAVLECSESLDDFDLCEAALEPLSAACKAKVARPWPALDDAELEPMTQTQ